MSQIMIKYFSEPKIVRGELKNGKNSPHFK